MAARSRDHQAEYARRNQRAQEEGYNSYAAKRKAQAAVPKVSTIASKTRKKVHAGRYIHDQAFDEEQHDLGPWTQTPASSRVAAFRYDYLNDALQVTWRNNSNHGYIYLGVSEEVYMSFGETASKGRYVNNVLNSYDYRLMTPDEIHALSNSQRNMLTRVKSAKVPTA
jgi:hypothetical protein